MDLISGTPDTYHIRLSRLGRNSKGQSITALVSDVQFLAHSSLSSFQVKTRSSHNRDSSNVLFADGHVTNVLNKDDMLTVDVGTSPYDALEMILDMFELLDSYN